MNIDPKVSVIIPVYKAEKYLTECVDSLLKQTYQNIEIILVDDGSPDTSPRICDDLAKINDKTFVLHKSNEGAAASRKKGIDMATGEFIMFVDADDWVEPDYVYSFIRIAVKESVDIVIGNYKIYKHGAFQIYHHHFADGYYDRKQMKEKVFPNMLSARPFYTFGIAPSMCGKLFKTNIVKKFYSLPAKKISLGEDACFTYSILLKCNSIFIVSNSMYIYRTVDGSVTHSYNPEFVQETENLKITILEIAMKSDWQLGNQLDEYIAYICWYVTKNLLFRSELPEKQICKIVNAYINQNFSFNALKSITFSKTTLKKKIGYIMLYFKQYRLIKLFSTNRKETL